MTDNPQENTADPKQATTQALPPKLSAETVEEVCAEMRESQLARFRTVTLDFSAVDIFTSPGMQLVIALEKSLLEAGGKLAISGVKPSVSAVMRDLGFERFLPLH